MVGNSSTSSSKSWPWGFLCALAIVAGLHWAAVSSDAFWRVCYLYGDIPKEDPLRLEAMLRLIPEDGQGARRVLLIGSSQTREGFDISYLNSLAGKQGFEFYNLGVAGSSQPIDIFMLKERLLRKHPDTIVYMPFVESFYADYDANDYNKLHHHFSYSIVPYFVKHFGWSYLLDKQRPLFDSVVGSVSVFYRFRKQFIRVAERFAKAAIAGDWRTTAANYEYTENKPPSYFEEAIREYDGYRYEPSGYTRVNEDLFESFAADVMAAGVRFVVVDGPVHPRMNVLVSPVADRGYHTYLADAADRLGFEYVPADGLPAFVEKDFVDFAHLNASGRQKLSRYMGEYMSDGVLAAGAGGRVSATQTRSLARNRKAQGASSALKPAAVWPVQ